MQLPSGLRVFGTDDLSSPAKSDAAFSLLWLIFSPLWKLAHLSNTVANRHGVVKWAQVWVIWRDASVECCFQAFSVTLKFALRRQFPGAALMEIVIPLAFVHSPNQLHLLSNFLAILVGNCIFFSTTSFLYLSSCLIPPQNSDREVPYNPWEPVIRVSEPLDPLFPPAVSRTPRFISVIAKSAEVFFCFISNGCQTQHPRLRPYPSCALGEEEQSNKLPSKAKNP